MKIDWELFYKKWHFIPHTIPVKEGAHGVYIRLSKKRGVKILVNETIKEYTQLKTLKELKHSSIWKQAKKEFSFLKKAYKTKMTPKPFCLTYVYNELGFFYPAIVMEHIQGEPLYKAFVEKFLTEQVSQKGKFLSKYSKKEDEGIHWQDYVFEKFSLMGLVHEDLSESNCLVTDKNLIKIIDLGLATEIMGK